MATESFWSWICSALSGNLKTTLLSLQQEAVVCKLDTQEPTTPFYFFKNIKDYDDVLGKPHWVDCLCIYHWAYELGVG